MRLARKRGTCRRFAVPFVALLAGAYPDWSSPAELFRTPNSTGELSQRIWSSLVPQKFNTFNTFDTFNHPQPPSSCHAATAPSPRQVSFCVWCWPENGVSGDFLCEELTSMPLQAGRDLFAVW